MKKFKKISIAIAAMAMTVALTAGATMAYLTTTTNTKTNMFTAASDIAAELTETEWNEDSGKNYVPGKEIKKNPAIVLGADSTSAYVAIKIDYKNKAGNVISEAEFNTLYAKFNDLAEDSKWVKVATEGTSVFYVYKDIVNKGQSTDDLFSTITITAAQTEGLEDFSIDISGYAVQSEGFADYSKAQTELLNLAGLTKAE